MCEDEKMTFLDNYYTNFLDFVYYYTIPVIFLFFILMKITFIYKNIMIFIFSYYVQFLEERMLLESNKIKNKNEKKFLFHQKTQSIFIFIIKKISFFLNKGDKIFFEKISKLSQEEFKLFYQIHNNIGLFRKPTFSPTYGIYLFRLLDKEWFMGSFKDDQSNNYYVVYDHLEKDIRILENLVEKGIILFDKNKKLSIKNDNFIYLKDRDMYHRVINQAGEMIGCIRPKNDSKTSFYYVRLDKEGQILKYLLEYLIAKKHSERTEISK